MRRIATAAALIAVLTVASRVAGFARTVVFAWAIGATDLGDIYLVANTIPNIIFEIVAGGALAGLVVPLLAGPVDRGDRATVNATTSALLTWTLCLLVPAAALVALFAGPIIGALAAGSAPDQIETGVRMLWVFAPQLPLYGIGIVLTGVLQAHHRFAWPVLAPLLSSLTVIGAYLTFAAVAGRGAPIATVGIPGELILSVGTTLGVAVLSLCLLIPLRGLALRPRPSLHFPPGVRRTAGGLALAGAVTVAAQQLALLVVLRLAMAGPEGSLVLLNLAQAIFLLPWAVLAVPVAVAAYPTLAAAGARGDSGVYAPTLAGAVRGVLLLSSLGAAALIALAVPAAEFLVTTMPATGSPDTGVLAGAIAGFAPGLVGYGLFAVLTRALYARGDTVAAVVSTVVGWAAVMLAALSLAATLAADRRAVALAIANTVGMTVLGAAMLGTVARRAGRAALAGAGRAGLAGFVAAVVAAAAGLGIVALADSTQTATPSVGGSLVPGMLSGVTVVAVFLGVAYLADRRDLAPVIAGLRRRIRGKERA